MFVYVYTCFYLYIYLPLADSILMANSGFLELGQVCPCVSWRKSDTGKGGGALGC